MKQIDRNSKAYRQGATDFYYSRSCNPSIKDGVTRISLTSPEDIANYKAGYEEETERKDWGA